MEGWFWFDQSSRWHYFRDGATLCRKDLRGRSLRCHVEKPAGKVCKFCEQVQSRKENINGSNRG